MFPVFKIMLCRKWEPNIYINIFVVGCIPCIRDSREKTRALPDLFACLLGFSLGLPPLGVFSLESLIQVMECMSFLSHYRLQFTLTVIQPVGAAFFVGSIGICYIWCYFLLDI